MDKIKDRYASYWVYKIEMINLNYLRIF